MREYDGKNSREQNVVEEEDGGGCREGYQTNGKAEYLIECRRMS